MKQLRRCVTPLCAAVLSAMTLNANAALYRVIELTVSEDGENNTYALDATSPNADEGVVVGVGTAITETSDGDLDGGDDETNLASDNLGEYDLNGDGDDEDLVDDLEDWMLRYMSDYQQTYVAMVNDSLMEWERVNVWDTINPEDGEYRGTTNDYFFGVNDKRVAVGYGSAPYYIFRYEDEDTHDETYSIIRDFASRGFVYEVGDDVDGERIELTPEEYEYGGLSGAYDISDSGIAAGYSSVRFVEGAHDNHDSCIYDENLPEIVCDYRVANGYYGDTYHIEAYLWQLDSNANVIQTRALGHPIELDDDVELQLVSQAFAANDNGYAVGSSDNYIDTENPSLYNLREYAAIYTQYSKNDIGILDITDRNMYPANTVSETVSRATDINNNNIVIGYAIRYINTSWRTKAWYYDISSNSPEMIELPSFFESSSMTAKSINDYDMVVGEFEWEPRPGGVTRRRHGYLYDMRSDNFVDLNDAIECTDQFDIVEANVIRNDGVILATATTQQSILDENGDPIFDSNGDEITTTVARAIALEPIDGGDYDSCSDADEAFPDNEREGASFGLWSLLLPVAWFVRRRYTLSR
ncbi:DUF3466 family protein [Neiella marina]|uniref:DUF3466 family protein n=1 Tax=Neiella holothuriorum TaxID=2870530 RepID=A0ABS7EDA6_9GAMM|nr:DUF3466 family protein [Neiella holothuriorum]MBW8190324.1 DUF3466 family protein [Neiella holothuriorum]